MNNINTYNPHNIRLGNKAMYSNIISRNNETLNSSLSSLAQTRYFSAVDARIYFGDVYIDEVQQIIFQLSQNTMGITGYNSYVFDVVAQGARTIVGQFKINFTKSGYLYEILNSLSPVNSGATLHTISKQCNTPTVSKNIRAPMWDKCFNIVIPYGTNNVIDGDQVVSLSTTVILKGVYISACSQEFGTDKDEGGEPIAETYEFYARDIEFDNDSSKQNDLPAIDTTVLVKDDITIDKVTAKYNNRGFYDIVCQITNNRKNDIYDDSINVSIIFDSKYSIQLQYDQDNNYYYVNNLSTNKSQRNGFEYLIATYLFKSSMVGNTPIVTVSIDYLISTDDDTHNITAETQVTYA